MLAVGAKLEAARAALAKAQTQVAFLQHENDGLAAQVAELEK